MSSLALALGGWALAGLSGRAQAQEAPACAPCDSCGAANTVGTLGYGPPGYYPGFQGFGLGYRLGYGYGGSALGVGAEGGYPFYAGPGYPHPWPRLRRYARINPFPFYGGPGGPSPENPNYYGAVGPLSPDRQVITVGTDADYPSQFGAFSGTLPYTEEFLAPFTSAAAAGTPGGPGSYTPTTAPPAYAPQPPTAPSPMPPSPSPSPVPPSAAVPRTGSATAAAGNPARSLGIEVEPVVAAGGVSGMRIAKVYPGTTAANAGLQTGDVIHTMNGRLTTQPGHLTWVLTHAAPQNIVHITLRAARDGQERTVTAQLR